MITGVSYKIKLVSPPAFDAQDTYLPVIAKIFPFNIFFSQLASANPKVPPPPPSVHATDFRYTAAT
jgi:hypothetical protein